MDQVLAVTIGYRKYLIEPWQLELLGKLSGLQEITHNKDYKGYHFEEKSNPVFSAINWVSVTKDAPPDSEKTTVDADEELPF